MIVDILKEKLPQEVLDLCRDTFNTHIGMEGATGKGIDPKFRKTECRYIMRAKREGAEHPRALQLTEQWINDIGYPDLTPEILQIARYHETNFYSWHTDGEGRGYRKLSMSCLLNSPDEFEGGEMEFRLPSKRHREDIIMEGQKTVVKLRKDYPILFKPDLPHQVLPVTRGVRDSLVVWFLDKEKLTKGYMP